MMRSNAGIFQNPPYEKQNSQMRAIRRGKFLLTGRSQPLAHLTSVFQKPSKIPLLTALPAVGDAMHVHMPILAVESSVACPLSGGVRLEGHLLPQPAHGRSPLALAKPARQCGSHAPALQIRGRAR